MERDQEDAPGRDGEISSETLGCKLCGLCVCTMSSYIQILQVHILLLTLNHLGLLVIDNPRYWGF